MRTEKKHTDGSRVVTYTCPARSNQESALFSKEAALQIATRDIPKVAKQLLEELAASAPSVTLRIVTAPTYDHPRLAYYSDK